MRRYVYRGPAEPAARPTASLNQNVLTLGAVPAPWLQDGIAPRGPCPAWGCDGPPRIYPIFANPGVVDFYEPVAHPIWRMFPPGGGATSTVSQPPPSSGGTLTVPIVNAPPISPAPSPTVPGDTSLSLTQPGQTLAQQTGTPWDIGTWLGESTLFSSLPNWAVAGGGLVLAWMVFSGKAGRR